MSDAPAQPIRGRGASGNPGNRFESARQVSESQDMEEVRREQADPDVPDRSVRLTQYLPDASRSIIASNNSPDVPFDRSINPYRGCSHGCIYCYARPTHEYLGMSAGLDFETRILVKHDAPELLRKELASAKWKPQVIACSGVTDCYQPIERELQLTRRCLEVLREYRNPVGIVTKNHLVTRDIDILREMAAWPGGTGVQVFLSITSLNADLTRIMEPRTSVPRDRLRALRELSAAGIPVGVMVAPVLPALTDHEMPAILEAARDAGASLAGFVPLRLPFGVKELFVQWLEQHFPDRKEKMLNRIRDLRGGELNDPNAFSRMRGEGVWADQMKQTFELHARRLGLNQRRYEVNVKEFRTPGELPLFSHIR